MQEAFDFKLDSKIPTQGERMNHNGNNIESRLWDAADELRANSKLKCSGQVKTDSRLSRFLEIPVLLFKLSWGKISQIRMKTVAVIKHLNVFDDVLASFVAC